LERVQRDLGDAQARSAAANAAHVACHSGGMCGPLLCSSVDCPALFIGAKADQDAQAALQALDRFQW
jgi:hypothetical protein